ncbi:hypothetical protein Tco_0615592 [Tanacetum coccineum]
MQSWRFTIAISFDTLEESVDHSPPEDIFCDIPLLFETTLVASPTGLCGLVPYSGSDSDSPDEEQELSSGDSSERPLHSSSPSAGLSRKRCRSLVDYVPSSTPVMGSLAPTHDELLPPRKRFRDSYSSEASIEEDIEIDPI